MEHKNLTLSFLNAILRLEGDRRIASLEFLSQELLPRMSGSKKSILDVRCTDHRGFQYLIEVQNKSMQMYLQRIQHDVAYRYSSQLKKKENYLSLKPVTLLSILNYNLFDEAVPTLSFHTIREQETGLTYMNDMSYAFIELPKFHKRWEECVSLEEQWIYTLKEAKNLEKIPLGAPTEILETFDILEQHSWSPDEQDDYMRAKMAIMDDKEMMRTAREEGREEGIEMGAKQKAVEMARKLLAADMSMAFVLETSGLSEDDLLA